MCYPGTVGMCMNNFSYISPVVFSRRDRRVALDRPINELFRLCTIVFNVRFVFI
jgi:hypothetical protein